ncbi:hypothetical protein VTJ04DRAFT_2527 [Mycothermus thermophilus]|uniref:uncharacterized protein n=1 Tax=Humicola insolens TaxID=85995 RepID=UPI003742E621
MTSATCAQKYPITNASVNCHIPDRLLCATGFDGFIEASLVWRFYRGISFFSSLIIFFSLAVCSAVISSRFSGIRGDTAVL